MSPNTDPTPRRRVLRGLLGTASCLAAPGALASTPTEAARLVVPYPPGAGTDAVARLLAAALPAALARPCIVDNRPGANGNVGTAWAARARPDGLTLCVATPGPFTVAPAGVSALRFDPARDFSPIALLNESPIVLVVHERIPATSLAELERWARERRQPLNAALPTAGSVMHLLTEAYAASADLPITGIPYKGGAAAVNDLLGQHVEVLLSGLPSVASFIAQGKLKALAVASAERAPALPGVPTFKELGHAGVLGSSWNGLAAPRGVPAQTLTRIGDGVEAWLRSDEARRALAGLGSEPRGGGSARFADFLAQETARWQRLVRERAIRLE